MYRDTTANGWKSTVLLLALRHIVTNCYLEVSSAEWSFDSLITCFIHILKGIQYFCGHISFHFLSWFYCSNAFETSEISHLKFLHCCCSKIRKWLLYSAQKLFITWVMGGSWRIFTRVLHFSLRTSPHDAWTLIGTVPHNVVPASPVWQLAGRQQVAAALEMTVV